MIQRLSDIETAVEEGSLAGQRMTADQFLELVDDGMNCELVDGVVIMSPSPTPRHQDVATEIVFQLRAFLRGHPIGKALVETDVSLGRGPTGGDLVYKPEVVYYRKERLAGMHNKLTGPPDLVVEVLSPGTRAFDRKTKKDDYERLGVHEYWIVDPDEESFTFYRHGEGRFVEVAAESASFRSEVVSGFVLDLARVREMFKPWT